METNDEEQSKLEDISDEQQPPDVLGAELSTRTVSTQQHQEVITTSALQTPVIITTQKRMITTAGHIR